MTRAKIYFFPLDRCDFCREIRKTRDYWLIADGEPSLSIAPLCEDCADVCSPLMADKEQLLTWPRRK